jgi:hypothetical protein
MRRIQLWSVGTGDGGRPAAESIHEISSTETERLLEDVLVESPDLLVTGVSLIGRQVPTQGGPLDLVGIDSEGRAVVFELKRGTLTRDAVAQILDYVSDLAAMEPDDFARLIEKSSGAHGIPEIDDFNDWFGREFPDAVEFDPERTRMVLIGLGVDERAKRIVNYLADKGIDIQLLTFHAFRKGTEVFIARQTETKGPTRPPPGGAGNKEDNERHLLQLAEEMQCQDLLESVARFIDERLPAYKWPGKSAYSFSLQERTAEGRPSLRAYVTLYVHRKQKGYVSLTLADRAMAAAGEGLTAFRAAVPYVVTPHDKTILFQVDLDTKRWPDVQAHLDQLLREIHHGWERKRSREDTEAAEAGLDADVTSS